MAPAQNENLFKTLRVARDAILKNYAPLASGQLTHPWRFLLQPSARFTQIAASQEEALDCTACFFALHTERQLRHGWSVGSRVHSKGNLTVLVFAQAVFTTPRPRPNSNPGLASGALRGRSRGPWPKGCRAACRSRGRAGGLSGLRA